MTNICSPYNKILRFRGLRLIIDVNDNIVKWHVLKKVVNFDYKVHMFV